MSKKKHTHTQKNGQVLNRHRVRELLFGALAGKLAPPFHEVEVRLERLVAVSVGCARVLLKARAHLAFRKRGEKTVLFLLLVGHEFLLAPQAAAHSAFVRLSQAAPPRNQGEASRRDRRELARDFFNGHGALFRRRVVHETARDNVQVLASFRDAFFALCAL